MKKIRTTTGREFGFTKEWADRAIVIAQCEDCGAEFPYDSELDMICYDCTPETLTPEEIAEEDAILEEMKVELMRDGKMPAVWS